MRMLPLKMMPFSVIIALSYGLPKTILTKQRLDADFLEHGEGKPQLSKQKRLHVKGALEVNNTRDTSRILSIKKGIYYFVILIFLYHLLFPLEYSL